MRSEVARALRYTARFRLSLRDGVQIGTIIYTGTIQTVPWYGATIMKVVTITKMRVTGGLKL